MGVPASVGFRTAAQVMSCIECHECLNACWYYPETTYIAGEGMTENPYAGRCRNCGSRKIVIGEISILEMQKWERQGWEFIPWHEQTDIPNPAVKNNVFQVRNNHVFSGR